MLAKLADGVEVQRERGRRRRPPALRLVQQLDAGRLAHDGLRALYVHRDASCETSLVRKLLHSLQSACGLIHQVCIRRVHIKLEHLYLCRASVVQRAVYPLEEHLERAYANAAAGSSALT